MRQKFKRVDKHLYESVSRNSNGDTAVSFYARFTCRLKHKARAVPLGDNFSKAKDRLRELLVQDSKLYDFDLDRQRKTVARDGKAEAFTFAEWAPKYPAYAKGKDGAAKRSLPTDLILIKHHIEPFFGALLLTDFTRETLTRYIQKREGETIIRCGKASKKKVSRGTISNELSLLRRMLKIANREGFKATVPNFEGLIVRTDFGGRELTEQEQTKALSIYAPWMQRLARFAGETCLSEGDLIRLTYSDIDEARGVVKPAGGRKKTNVEQISPLTHKARAVLDEIRSLTRTAAIVPNVNSFVFTLDDGKPITKGLINYQVERAIRAGMAKFRFHDYRHSALTKWAREKIHVDVAMIAAGHSSVQMHRRYTHLQDTDIAAAFGSAQNIVTRSVTRKRVARRN